jgi:hypothetical protein
MDKNIQTWIVPAVEILGKISVIHEGINIDEKGGPK